MIDHIKPFVNKFFKKKEQQPAATTSTDAEEAAATPDEAVAQEQQPATTTESAPAAPAASTENNEQPAKGKIKILTPFCNAWNLSCGHTLCRTKVFIFTFGSSFDQDSSQFPKEGKEGC